MLRQLFVSVCLVSAVDEDSSSLLQGLKQSNVSQHMLANDIADDSDGHDGEHQHQFKLDMIATTPCVWFKTLINLDLVPVPSCVTDEDLITAMKAMGIGPVLQAGTLNIFNGAIKELEPKCLDLAAIEGQVSLEHVSSTGITDPIFNKDRFEDIFRGEGKKHDKSVVAMTNITAKTLAGWQIDQNERVADGEDQEGEAQTNPYGVYGIIFDLFGEDADPPETFGKIMQYDDLKNLVEWGEAPPNACATALDNGQCAEVPYPDFGIPGTDSVRYAVFEGHKEAQAAMNSLS